MDLIESHLVSFGPMCCRDTPKKNALGNELHQGQEGSQIRLRGVGSLF